MKKLLLFISLILGGVLSAQAQQASSAYILSTCGTLPAGVTYAAGQYGILTMDTTGKLCDSATGGGGGGTSATYGAAFPSTGTPAGGTDGTNFQPLVVDTTTHYLQVDVKAGGAGGGAVYGPTAGGSAAANPPVLMGGTIDGTTTGNVDNWKVASGLGYVSAIVPSGGVASGAIASGAIASGAVASGAYASGSISDGAVVTLGAKADAKNAATDTTAISVMSVLKEISSLEQAPASRAVTNAGTFATQSAITAASGALASGSIAAGAVSAGAYVSGSVLSGAYASGSLASGAVVDLTNIEGVIGNATAPTKMAVSGGVYNSSPLTLTTGQSSALQLDANGYLAVNIKAGAGSGGTASNFGSAFPSAGTAIGLANGTNMVAWSATTNYGTAPAAIAVPAVNAFITNATPGIANNVDGVAAVAASSTSPVPVNNYGYLWNGATWDRTPGSTTGAQVKIASGGVASGAIASGAIASGAIAAGAVSAGAYVSGSVLSGAYASGSLASGAVVDITNMSASTGAAPPSKAIYLGANASGATGGHVAGLVSCDNHVFKHITSATDTMFVQGVSSQVVYVCSWRSRAAGVATWYLETEADQSASCNGTLAQINGIATEAANTGETWGGNFWSGLKGASGYGLCSKSTGTGGVDVDVWYAQF